MPRKQKVKAAEPAEETKHAPRLQTEGPGKGLPFPEDQYKHPEESEEEEVEVEVKPCTEKFPKDLAKSLDLLRAELAKPEKGQKKQDKARLNALRVHIAELQNGKAPAPLGAKYLAETFRKQTELGRETRLVVLSRSNRDVAWLLAEYQKLSAPKKSKE